MKSSRCLPEGEPFLAGAQRCFAACQESLAGEPCACNPRLVVRPTPWDAEPVECLDYGPLRMVVCPLGDDCLGFGPVCFAVAGALYVLALDSATIAS